MASIAWAAAPPKPGFVLHFDFLSNAREGRALVDLAVRAGAEVINVVPPAHIWENPAALSILDEILNEIASRKLSFVFTRIDASYPPDHEGKRFFYLYSRILNEPGRLPNGHSTAPYFLTTAGLDNYAEWMEEETRYYARRYGQLPNLLGINLGPFSEPFASERGGFLEYMDETESYEITQYTPHARKLWHQWLLGHYEEIAAVNREYGSSFASLEDVPLPKRENDTRFGRPRAAYFDFVRSLNDWFVERYERCRRIWHEVSGRDDVPLILQFNGALAEKFVRGRPSFAAFDIPGWIARADAVGLSLYTNSGYPDFAHASIEATVRLAALARDLGKDVFVLEGGCEAPNVVLIPRELAFFGSVARRLQPRTYIYEFLKDKFDEPYRSNPGKLMRADGRIRQQAFKSLRKLFAEIKASVPVPEAPLLCVVSEPILARENPRSGKLNGALYDLAATVPVRWVPAGAKSIICSGIPILKPDGSVEPPNVELSRLLESIPPVDSTERGRWRRSVSAALTRLKAPPIGQAPR